LNALSEIRRGGDAAPEMDDAAWMSDRLRTARAGAAVATAMTYAAQALSILTIPLYLRYLGRDQYGQMLLLVTLQSYLSQTNLGLNWAAVNMIGAARASRDRREFVVVVQNALVLGAATAVVALAVSGAIAVGCNSPWASLLRMDEAFDPWAIIAVGCLAANSLIGGPVYLTFVGMGQSSVAALYQGVGRLLSIPAMLYVAWAWRSVAGMLYVNAVVLTLVLVAATAHFLRRFPAVTRSGLHISREQWGRQLRMGLKNVSAEVGFLLHASAPMVALGVTCGAGVVPLYAVPRALLDAAFTFGRQQYSVLQPAYAEAERHGRDAAITQMLARSLTRNLAVLGILCAGFIVLCGPFVALWTADRLDVSRATAVAVAAGAAAMFYIQLFQLFLVSTNRQLKATRILVTTGVASMVVTVAAGWAAAYYGVVFAAAATSLATAGVFGINTLLQLEVTMPLGRGLAKCAAIGAIFAVTVVAGLAADRLLAPSLPEAAVIIITGVLMTLCYAAGLAGLGLRRGQ
jgi:O-antigen/teichoic acid export membrane protein